jgi:hypothetical protein
VTHLQEAGAIVFALVKFESGAADFKKKPGWVAAERISEGTGGSAYGIKSPSDLVAALNQLQVLLRSSYVLKYRAAGKPDKNKFVALKIDVQRNDASVPATRSSPRAIP